MPFQKLHPTTPEAPVRKRTAAAGRLAERLRPLALDRVASARAAAQEAARELHAWALQQAEPWSAQEAAVDLEGGWHEWCEHQAWRGACARLVDDVRRSMGAVENPRSALAAEARAWIGESEALGTTPKLSDLERVLPHARENLHHEDWVLVHGYSELCVKALAAAQQAGLAPRVLVSELAADASGKRLARELLTHGVHVRLSWDMAAVAAVEEVDRVWLGTEAVGAGVHVGHVGTSLLLEQAREAEVPTRVLATEDDLVPGGEARLPIWGDDETETLWCFAPEGVELAAQPFELVDSDRVDGWITEEGLESFGSFCLRALRAETAPALTT